MELSASGNLLLVTYKKTTFAYSLDNKIENKKADIRAYLFPNKLEDNDSLQVSINPLVIDGPGEYEIEDVSVEGVAAEENDGATIYRLVSPDGSSVVFLPEIAAGKLDESILDKISPAQIVAISLGGGTDEEKQKSILDKIKLIKLIDPSVVVLFGPSDKDGLQHLTSELGAQLHTDQAKLKTKDLATIGEEKHLFVFN